AAWLAELPKSLDQVASTEEKQAIVEGVLEQFRRQHSITDDCVCVGLPGRQTFCRVVNLPPMAGKKLDAAVRFEARRAFPFPLTELEWAYQPLVEAARTATSPNGAQPILIVAARRSFIDEHLAMFERAGIRAKVLQSDALAVCNHFDREGLLPGGDPSRDASNRGPSEAVAMVDIGSDTTGFLVWFAEGVWFHSAGMGSEKINRALARQFGVTMAEAERLKRSPSKSRDLRQWHDAARSVFDDVAHEIHWALSMFGKVHPDTPVNRILAVGGGFETHGLLRYLLHGR
ncbi:MAG: pilus assembly protein PilM, partial [Pirellulales bacterium]|nr:pilus assembly protein PilM [Pirellulales bacterium]